MSFVVSGSPPDPCHIGLDRRRVDDESNLGWFHSRRSKAVAGRRDPERTCAESGDGDAFDSDVQRERKGKNEFWFLTLA